MLLRLRVGRFLRPIWIMRLGVLIVPALRASCRFLWKLRVTGFMALSPSEGALTSGFPAYCLLLLY